MKQVSSRFNLGINTARKIPVGVSLIGSFVFIIVISMRSPFFLCWLWSSKLSSIERIGLSCNGIHLLSQKWYGEWRRSLGIQLWSKLRGGFYDLRFAHLSILSARMSSDWFERLYHPWVKRKSSNWNPTTECGAICVDHIDHPMIPVQNDGGCGRMDGTLWDDPSCIVRCWTEENRSVFTERKERWDEAQLTFLSNVDGRYLEILRLYGPVTDNCLCLFVWG